MKDIEVPIAIFSGNHDTLSDPVDVDLLISKLRNLVYLKKLEKFNHLDFVTGANADVILYPDILRLCHKYSNLIERDP